MLIINSQLIGKIIQKKFLKWMVVFYINKNYWKDNKDNTSDYMRTKDTRFFINSFNSLLESIDIDNYNDLNFARSLKMNF